MLEDNKGELRMMDRYPKEMQDTLLDNVTLLCPLGDLVIIAIIATVD